MAGLARPVCLRAGLALQAVEEALAVFRRCLRVPRSTALLWGRWPIDDIPAGTS
jgi:hypothetical protein